MSAIASAYARFSDEEQRPTSIDDQLRRCRQIAQAEGLILEDRLTFADSAITGLEKGRAKRHQYQRLIDAVEARECAVLITDEISRLTREVKEGGHLMELVEKIGLRIITADGIDTARDGWRTMWLAKLMTARMEVEATGRRTTRGMLGQLERGYQIAQAPFGYRAVLDVAESGRVLGTRWVIHEEEASIVRSIYQWRHEGLSARLIAVALQRTRVPPPGASRRDGKPYWRPSSVSRLWTNGIYRGVFTWNGSGFAKSRARRRREELKSQEFERPHLRLVSDELWYSCNARRRVASGTRAPNGGGKRLFSGLVRCGDCEALLALGNGPASYSLYCPQCEAATRVGAQDEWIGYSSVGAAKSALHWVLRQLFTGEVRQEFHRRLAARIQEGPVTEEQQLRHKAKELQLVIDRLKTLMMNPAIEQEVFAPEMEARSQEMRALKHRLAAVRMHLHSMTPEVLRRQKETDPLPLLEGLLEGREEPYKAKATLRRLLARFTFVKRPQRGTSVFHIGLRPGVCIAEVSDTAVIDETEVAFEVVASTTGKRPVVWSVTGRRI